MSGIGLILLILAIVAMLAALYFTAWCMCQVQRNHKEGHYILEADQERDDDIFNKKQLYTGLDMVDEARDTGYLKNPLDLDSLNENKPIPRNATTISRASAPAEDGDSTKSNAGSDVVPPV